MLNTHYQIFNHRRGLWVVVDRETKKIIQEKKTNPEIPFKGIPRGYRPPKKEKKKGFWNRLFGDR